MTQTAKLNTNTGPAQKYAVAWSAAASDYNILEAGPGGSAGCAFGICCRRLTVASPAGALVVIDQAGSTVTIPQAILTASPVLEIQARALVAAGSGAATVFVEW